MKTSNNCNRRLIPNGHCSCRILILKSGIGLEVQCVQSKNGADLVAVSILYKSEKKSGQTVRQI